MPVHLQRTAAPPLRFRWHPAPGPRAVLVLVHGFGEHSGRYLHVLEALACQGFAGAAFDLRGHGESAGRRTHVARFDDYLDDVDTALTEARARAPGRPVFVLGHSLGGLVAACFAAERERGLAGLALSSPALAFALPIPCWKHWLGVLASHALPALRLPTGTPLDQLSRDPAVVQRLRSDPLVDYTATARWYAEALRAQGRALANADRLELPVLLLLAGRDGLVDTAASHRWFERLASSDVKEVRFPRLYHELLQEPERAEVLAELTSWLRAHAPEPPAAAPRLGGEADDALAR